MGLNDLVRTLASSADLDESVADALISGVDETYSLIAKYAADPNETCNFIIVADSKKLQIGVVNYGDALAFESDEPASMVLQSMLDEVKHQVLPTRGHLLTLTKMIEEEVAA